MFLLRCVILLISCLILVSSSQSEIVEFSQPPEAVTEEYEPVVLSRHVRSPRGGNVNIGYNKDKYGREASVRYNHNLYTSRNGRGSIDAYAYGSRNFDWNRNNYGGGIRGSWRF